MKEKIVKIINLAKDCGLNFDNDEIEILVNSQNEEKIELLEHLLDELFKYQEKKRQHEQAKLKREQKKKTIILKSLSCENRKRSNQELKDKVLELEKQGFDHLTIASKLRIEVGKIYSLKNNVYLK